jgi:hypothetical protein
VCDPYRIAKKIQNASTVSARTENTDDINTICPFVLSAVEGLSKSFAATSYLQKCLGSDGPEHIAPADEIKRVSCAFFGIE